MGALGDSLRSASADDYRQHNKAEMIKKWTGPIKERYPGYDDDVLFFIAYIRFHSGYEGEEVIERLFASGYCYYFALMLQDAFKRGVVCNNGRSHFVWLDGTNPNTDIAYDISGVYADYEVLIPAKAMGECIYDFVHVPGLVHNTSKEEIEYLTNLFKNADDLGGYV